MGRAPCCSKLGLNKGAWSAEEDSLLVEYIHTHGEGDWRSLPKKSGLRRCGKSCRLRWLNYLRPSIKRGNITPDEEELIIRMHALLGNRWSMIAGRVPGRTDNEIKNYWNTNLSKKLATRGIDPKTHKFISSSNKAGDRFNQFKELEKQHYCSKRPQHLEPNAAKVCQSTELVIPNVHKGDLKVQYTENKSSSRLLPVESRDTNISISGSSNDCCNYTPADSAERASLSSISDSVLEAKYASGDLHDNGSHVNEKHDELAEYDVFSLFNVSNAENEICCNVDKGVDEEDAHQFMKKESQFALLHGDEERVQIDEEESGNLGSLSMNAHDFSHQASNGVTVMSWEAAFWYKFLSPSPNAQ